MAKSITRSERFDQRYPILFTIVLTVVVLIVVLFSIMENQRDSYELLAEQGRAFTEALAQASENAIASETYYDYFVRARLSGLAVSLLDRRPEELSEQEWASFALSHDLLGAYIYDERGAILGGVTIRGGRPTPPDYVEAEVDSLLADPESRFILLFDEGENPGGAVHYYLELNSRMDQVVVLVSEALLFAEALDETGISRLAEAMAREPGVAYIAYQTPDDIVFSSQPSMSLSDIESDVFLTAAMDADSIVERLFTLHGNRILELVRPFSTPRHPFGLFRVGLSLDRYYAVSRGYDTQMIIISGVLIVLLFVALAYLRGRQKRFEMAATFERQAARRERLSEMGNLAAGVAHEIRNPLNAISIAAQRLEKEFSPPENAEQFQTFTQQIRTETKRLNETITRFLALSHENKRQSKRVDLNQFLADVGDLLQTEGDRIGLKVIVQSEMDLAVQADPDRLKELFLNLFNNSKEALAGKPGRFEIAAKRNENGLEITVTDTGPGISPELHEKVFAPYYTTKEAGTGLGLPTVQRIVADLGGEVGLDLEYSKGVRFVISLPEQATS